jgi:hypothetical protein
MQHGLAERLKQDERIVKTMLTSWLATSGVLFGSILFLLTLAAALVLLE